MSKNLTHLSSLLFIAACSTSAILEMPSVPEPPANWNRFATSTLPDSNCPNIEGEYAEPPMIYKSGEMVKANSGVKTGSYYGHFPFHLADRKELPAGQVRLESNQFSIRQMNADNFYFSFLTKNGRFIEYHFRAEEGDFECKNGYIEFPAMSSYGMIEGMSVNSQIRNVVLRDNTGALIIQETIGPYRGDPSAARSKFKHEFLRYPLYEKFSKEN